MANEQEQTCTYRQMVWLGAHMTLNPLQWLNRVLSRIRFDKPHLVGVPACCGATMVVGLPVNWQNHDSFRSFLKSYVTYRNHCYMAISTPAQTGAGEVLREHGFEPVKKFVNRNSGNELTLWVRAATY